MRFSRKLVLSLVGVLLLGGASGVAAVYVGTERIFGPSWESQNGLSCTTAQTVTIRKNGTFWIRKFIRTQGGDGAARLRTAIRVARTVHEHSKPDLVQVSVLDSKGPQVRSEMRGRAIAAQVVYIPDPTKIPEGTDNRRYAAFYLEGAAGADGQFYGLKIDLPLEDIEAMATSINDVADCADVGTPGEAHAKAAPGAPAAGGHGAPEASSHDAGKQEGGEGHEAPAPEAGEPKADHGAELEPEDETGDLLTSTPANASRSIFSLGYLRSLVFGDEAAATEQPAASASDELARNEATASPEH